MAWDDFEYDGDSDGYDPRNDGHDCWEYEDVDVLTGEAHCWHCGCRRIISDAALSGMFKEMEPPTVFEMARDWCMNVWAAMKTKRRSVGIATDDDIPF